jgi:hypothetical protein
MNLRALAPTRILAVALLSLLVTLNWPAFTSPTPLSLGLTEVGAPLGIPEITVSMIGISTDVYTDHGGLRAQLRQIRDVLGGGR